MGARGLTIVDWADGDDPFAAASAFIRARRDRWASPTPPGRLHLLGLQDALPGPSLPLADAVACPCSGRSRTPTSSPGWPRRAPPRTPRTSEILGVRFAGRKETDVAADLARLLREFGHEQVDFTVVGSGPERRQPPPRGRRPRHRGRRRGRARLRRPDGRLRLGHQPHRLRRRAVRRGPRGARDRAAGTAGGRGRGPAGRCLSGHRPGGSHGHHRRGLRRAVHPPHRPRHRHDDPRTAVHDRGRGAAAGARDVLLRRAGHLPRRTLRRPDRGHRDRHRGRRPAGSTTPIGTCASWNDRRPDHP